AVRLAMTGAFIIFQSIQVSFIERVRCTTSSPHPYDTAPTPPSCRRRQVAPTACHSARLKALPLAPPMNP
ncbi:MAG: hypothetical protein MUQ10_13425, partial [Anaerolineae bacterium]|nr:hypothetical protein [Anaerolineae bacterium]